MPGDKSISHRAVILGSLASGRTVINGLLEAEDVQSTIRAFREMGVSISKLDEKSYEIIGVGLKGLKEPNRNLHLGNSGTAIRLLCGVLVGQSFDCILTGDESLRSRPMTRVTDPLGKMGANIRTTSGGVAPIMVMPKGNLTGIHYETAVASAQVKSALLLAGLYATGSTVISEPQLSRDHTERMLRNFGCPVQVDGNTTRIQSVEGITGKNISIPGDLSSAAFFIVAATIADKSQIELKGIGFNPTRTGLIDILREMGADIVVTRRYESVGEPLVDLIVRSSQLRGINVPPGMVPRLIDEFPILAVAAAAAQGVTRISGANELRFKESDRITSVVAGLRSLGVSADETADGMIIEGGTILGGTVDSCGDHRVAMAFAIAGVLAKDSVRVLNCDNIATSFPEFDEVSTVMGLDLLKETSDP
tara:strand:- start:693 stop:1955 length:1263 start_codon:yes stop_codon:yes gene_type:complete